MDVRDRERVKELLKAACNGRAWQALWHLLDGGESTVQQVREGIGGSKETVQQLLIELYRQRLVLRRTDEDEPGNQGRRPYLYSVNRPVKAWLRLTEQMVAQTRGARG